MISIHALALYCGIYAVAIAVPGPGIVAIVARALNGGVRATIPAVMGNTLGDLVLMTLSVLGLSLVAHEMGRFFLAVKLSGAVYLIYLGYRYWTAPVAEAAVVERDRRRSFWAQLALTLGNPKAIVMFAALLPSVIDLGRLNSAGYAQLCACTLFLIPTIEFSYALLAAQARQALKGVVARRRMNKTAGVIMVGAGIGVAVT